MKLNNFFQWALLVILAIALLAACNQNKSAENAGDNPPSATATPTAEAEPPAAALSSAPTASAPTTTADGEASATASPDTAAAETLYAKGNCAMCHGHNQEGGKLGPALTGLAQHNWDSTKLQAYLANPSDHSVNEARLAELSSAFSMSMPAFNGTEAERKVLAEWLMTK